MNTDEYTSRGLPIFVGGGGDVDNGTSIIFYSYSSDPP